MNNQIESFYENIFVKGVFLIVGLTFLWYLLFGGYNQTYNGLEWTKKWVIPICVFYFVWHYKLILDNLPNINLKGLNLMITYSIMNLIIATGFSAQYLMGFGLYLALSIQGYSGSVYYAGLANMKNNIETFKNK